MTTKYDELLYKSGLTAQGAWDEMDEYQREAVLRFADMIVEEVAAHIHNSTDRHRKDYFAAVALNTFGDE